MVEEHNRREKDEKNLKPDYFKVHEESDVIRFDRIDKAIAKFPCREDLDNAVKKAVELHVNGKIRGLQATLDKYIADDTEWKKTADPAVTSYQKSSAFFSFVTDGTKFLIPVFGLIGIIYGFIVWIRNT